MTCRNCKCEFCWLCLGLWSTHGSSTGGYFACNIYERLKGTDEGIRDREAKQQDAAAEMQRYQLFFERFTNHAKSRKICIDDREKLAEKVSLLTEVMKYPPRELDFFN